MLLHLSVTHYAIARALDIEFRSGMTAITGETGAGKSILLDALGLALGDRSDPEAITLGEDRADICATFDLAGQAAACQWLEAHDFPSGEQEQCLLKRVVTREGRSRAYINGQPATLQQLRELGEQLIDIHSQHEHHSLLQRDTQRRLLDEFAGHLPLAIEVRELARQWQEQAQRVKALREHGAEQEARIQLLRYQVEELDRVAPQEGEADQLDAEYKRLNNAGDLIGTSEALLQLCGGSEHNNARDLLNQAVQLFRHSPLAAELPSVGEMLNSATIQIEEAAHDIQRYRDRVEVDPERLQTVEARQAVLFDLARKHRVPQSQLPVLHAQLQAEWVELTGGASGLDALEHALHALEQQYQAAATRLSAQRRKAAAKLEKQVHAQLRDLSMAHCRFSVLLAPATTNACPQQGMESVEFLISTQPDAPLRPLAKIASGGELSRISLAIQVVTARTSRTPTLVFDEVDVGIGGPTAVVVGKLLRQLGEQGQVLCVTHQAPVAARAHQHMQVSKHAKGKQLETGLAWLDHDARIVEIARMIGGETLTPQSRAHAEEMLAAG
ncbi:MAG: DNA repair protein RecN [Pseudomonadales bacterium]|nr:DNA repair protein RecN [Pseudomonadales bacterium]